MLNIPTQYDLMFIYLYGFSYKHINKPEEKFGQTMCTNDLQNKLP